MRSPLLLIKILKTLRKVEISIINIINRDLNPLQGLQIQKEEGILHLRPPHLLLHRLFLHLLPLRILSQVQFNKETE